MAVKETIVLDAQLNSTQAENSVKSLKAQLREAQMEVIKLSEQFGATSVQAREAAKKAAELKDAIGDAKALTDAFNPDRKFNALGSALSGVAGGFAAIQGAMALVGTESKDIEKTLLKVQAAMALAQGINAITESAEAFKNLKSVAIDAFNGIKKAIGSTGIGLFVVALGTIYAYWDDIKEAVNGVSAEQEKLNKKAKEQKEITADALKNIERQEETYKLQGKTQKEILKLKIQAVNKDIESQIAVIQTFETTKKEQYEAAKRNKDFLISLLTFLEAPVRFIYDNIFNGVNKLLGVLNKLPGIKIEPISTDFFDKANEFMAKKLFDPDQIKKDNDKTSKENDNLLKELINKRDGFKNEINEIDNKSAESKEKNNQKEEDDTKRLNAELLKNQQENTLLRIADERKRAMLKLEIDLENQKKEIENSKANTELKNKNIQALEERYMLDLRDMKAKFAEEDKKKAEEERKKAEEEAKRLLELQLKAEKETDDIVNNARLARIKDAAVKRQEEEAIRYQKEIDGLYNLLNNKEITEAKFNARREAMKVLHEAKLTEIEKINSDERQKKAEEEHQKKVAQIKQVGDTLGALTEVVGKETAVGKALAIAQATINTYQGATEVLRAKSILPEPAATVVKIANVAAIIASGIKSVKAIVSTKVPGGGGGGGSNPSMPTAAPIAPQMSSTAMNQAMINQMGNATNRAFVLESDVSGNQERIRRLNRAARIN